MRANPMNRFFLLVVAIGLLVIGAAVFVLGAFPPTPVPHPVQKVLPNDRFQSH